MKRPMGQFEVLQRTCDSYFDGNALLSQWNAVSGNSTRRIAKFFNEEGVKSFIEALKEDLSQSAKRYDAEIQVVKEIKGRNTSKGKTKGQVWLLN